MTTAVASNYSAAGVLALLEEDDYTLKAHALHLLSRVVDHYWAEIADAIPLIESLSDDDNFPHRELASYIASKCFFHLEEYSDALRLALGAGHYFDINNKSQYTDTMVATCIDEYISLRTRQLDATEDDMETIIIDPRMIHVVEKMFERCYADGEFHQAMGVALEARRLDQLKVCINRSTDVLGSLNYCFESCKTVVNNREFRLQVFEVMVEFYRSCDTPDYAALCQCLQMLNNYQEVTSILTKLVKSTNLNDCLIAYQVAFDLADNENQKFLMNIYKALPAQETGTEEEVPVGASPDYWSRIEKLKLILSGDFLVDLTLDFLHSKNNSDPLLMKTLKVAVENRNSVLHHSAVIAHAYMNCGTTSDGFLRENLEWLGKATNWAKFTATASLGVVHKGHTRESMNLLAPYLPSNSAGQAATATSSSTTSPYSEGGALYAMGLIHANKGLQKDSKSAETMAYLRNALQQQMNSTNAGGNGPDETVQHGACLGIGLCGLAAHDFSIYEELHDVLLTDSAVAGESAGYSIGLLLLGIGVTRGADILRELLAYAHETKHEKIIRGCVMGIALMLYEEEEHADTLIEQLIRDKDPLIRYGGIYAIAMAYVGTANNSAIRRLLHIAVSDVSDDVRRAAVTCLGFILFRTPVQVPKLVSLLSESFNPHVRYGACLAVGIACCGTAKNEAIQLLEPLLDDAVDYVRQGALMALSMVIMQESEGRNPKVTAIRSKILKLITDKHVTTMTKMGAIVAQGILDAGGRNVVISLQSHNGFTKMSSVVGLVMWAQHWFWYPLFHFMELSFQTTLCVGLNKDLKMPKGFTLTCHAKQSMFATPKHMEEKKEEKKELIATAVLSTTAKAKARLVKQETKEQSSSSMDVDMKDQPKGDKKDVDMETKQDDGEAMDMEVESVALGTKKKYSGKVIEPSVFQVTTPGRVTLAQEAFVTFDPNQRYVPILHPKQRPAGVIILKDTTPGEMEEVESVKAPVSAIAEDEADPPEPFEWEPPATNVQSTTASTGAAPTGGFVTPNSSPGPQ